jgi:hypothetical protein
MCFVFYHSLEWDAICGSCDENWCDLLTSKAFGIELSCCCCLTCVVAKIWRWTNGREHKKQMCGKDKHQFSNLTVCVMRFQGVKGVNLQYVTSCAYYISWKNAQML